MTIYKKKLNNINNVKQKYTNLCLLCILFIIIFFSIIYIFKYYKKINNIDSYENENNNHNVNDNNIKIKSIALVIPIHPPHYDLMYNLIKNIDDRIDIFLIFSNEIDYNNFTEKDKIKKIILPDNTNTKSIITYKKFYALKHHLINTKYDYFIVCDAELDIINDNFTEYNILNKINKIYENKIIYGGEIDYNTNPNVIDISKDSSNSFNDINKEKISRITNNFTLYTWWSDLPVYKREYLEDFFNYINIDNINNFDMIIYYYYLILYRNFIILNITPLISHNFSLESYMTDDEKMLDKLKEYKYGFSFIIPKLFNKHKKYLLNEGSFLLYHLDR